MNWFKRFAGDYPTLGSLAVIAGFLILTAGMIVNVRLALGKVMPDGYEFYFLFLGGGATGTLAAMIGKRLSDFRYKAAGSTTVNVEQAGTVKAEGDITVETKKEEAIG